MKASIKKYLDEAFRNDGLQITANVSEKAWFRDKPIKYSASLYWKESRKVMTLEIDGEYPFEIKLMPSNVMEPVKMIRFCEILIKAHTELVDKYEN